LNVFVFAFDDIQRGSIFDIDVKCP